MRPKPRTFTAQHLDRRTRAGKRAREIAAEIMRALGGTATPLQQQALERAAMFSAVAEDLAVRRLAGQPVNLDELLRAEGVARRALRLLGITLERPQVRPGLALAQQRRAVAKAKDLSNAI